MAQQDSCMFTLRQLYEAPLEYILNKYEGGFSLGDIYGGENIVEDFWSSPDITSDMHQNNDNMFVIPLSQCCLVETKEFCVS